MSSYLEKLYAAIQFGKGNILLEALAGCGKTTAICSSTWKINSVFDTLVLAFNRHVKDELVARQNAGKIPRNVWLKTSHSFGYGAITFYRRGQRVEVKDNKYHKILEEMIQPDSSKDAKEFWDEFGSTMAELTRHGRNNLAQCADDLYPLADHHGLEVTEEVIRLAWEAIRKGRENLAVIDYADMVYLPVYRRLPIKRFRYVFVDEAQDLSPAQQALVRMAIGNTGRAIFVGDRNQAIFGFAGAGVDSIDRIIAEFSPTVLPLPMTYRCGQAIVDRANEVLTRKGTALRLLAAPGNPVGSEETIPEEAFYSQAKSGDMVLCRVTSELVEPCFALIRRGIKATIRGTDIGKSLATLLEKNRKGTLEETIEALKAYTDREVGKLQAADKGAKAAALDDRAETIYALADGVATVDELLEKIETIFSDKVAGVVFSTVHKAKGLEARNVFILRRDLMPHPMGKKGWEREQEANLEYVAYTRAIERLTMVTPKAN